MKTKTISLGASFRDPSGFLFTRGGVLYRQVNQAYADDYTRLMESGLYEKLVKAGLLIPHTESDTQPADEKRSFKVLCPERVPFISYPYEWSFGQLKDAALATLFIQKRALKLGMSLKDASAYNIQFHRGKPMLIDTLSFETCKEGEPWVAYRQFCQHFLGPLALMAYRDVRLNQLLRVYIDGVPLDLASQLLPGRTRWNLGLSTHIHLHASAQKRYVDVAVTEARGGRKMSKDALLGLIESLRATVRKLEWKPAGTEWADYYAAHNYTDFAFEHKKVLVGDWLLKISPKTIWDLGANAGFFSRVAAETGAYVISSDIDPAAVELNYRQVKESNEQNLLPLVLDLTNPSPSIGWQNRERDSFLQRGPVDAVMALALVHHLAISNNVPLERVAEFFAVCGEWLIVEFVPKSDSQVQKLLRNRVDIFSEYTRTGFESAFGQWYTIQASSAVRDSERWLYLMKRK
ncbi:MAG: class I SAM-dependent methyltransferase [Candidatus Atribacteria bacterium]|nr:class I SAM-dependent methyltransferase [Candidatus Atribacteria bacterium]